MIGQLRNMHKTTDGESLTMIDERDKRIEELEAQLASVNWAFENRVQVAKDGDSWYATEYDFITLQESESGWGDTPVEAIADLQAALEKDDD